MHTGNCGITRSKKLVFLALVLFTDFEITVAVFIAIGGWAAWKYWQYPL